MSHAAYDPESAANFAIMLAMMCLRMIPLTMDRARVQDYSLKGKLDRAARPPAVQHAYSPLTGSDYVLPAQGFFTALTEVLVSPPCPQAFRE